MPLWVLTTKRLKLWAFGLLLSVIWISSLWRLMQLTLTSWMNLETSRNEKSSVCVALSKLICIIISDYRQSSKHISLSLKWCYSWGNCTGCGMDTPTCSRSSQVTARDVFSAAAVTCSALLLVLSRKIKRENIKTTRLKSIQDDKSNVPYKFNTKCLKHTHFSWLFIFCEHLMPPFLPFLVLQLLPGQWVTVVVSGQQTEVAVLLRVKVETWQLC